MGQVGDAAKAHKAAKTRLDSAKRQARKMVQEARGHVEETRLALAEAIVAEALEGTAQVDLIRASGYSREAVRTILRRGGVEPD